MVREYLAISNIEHYEDMEDPETLAKQINAHMLGINNLELLKGATADCINPISKHS
jgi:hypothetical protein